MRTIGILGLLALAQPAWAQDMGAGLELHGYVSQGFMASTDNDYLTAHTDRGSFDFFEAAVNVSKEFNDQFRAGLQVYALELGDIGHYQPNLDWAFVDYHPKQWIGVRAGRVRTPLGLYTETLDLDVSRTQVLLPPSMYEPTYRDFIGTFNGASIYGRIPMGRGGLLGYDAYAGGAYVPTHAGGNYDVKYLAGGRLMWETPLRGLRLGGSYFRADFDIGEQLGDPMMTTVTESFPNFTMLVGSLEYQFKDFVASIEYARWFADTTVTPALFVDNYNQERAYAMLTWHPTERLSTSGYFSTFTPDVSNRDGAGMMMPQNAYQRDWAASLRFDVVPWWIVKAEAHYINGTASAQAVGAGAPVTNWGLFLLKTTVAF